MKRKKRIFIPIVALLLCAAVGIIFVLETRISKVRGELSVLEARSIASSAASYGIDKALRIHRYTYKDLVTFHYDENNNIQSLSTDALMLNNIGNDIGAFAEESIGMTKVYETGVPLSVLIGSEIMSGRGPFIPIQITMRSIASTSYSNSFTDSGINQTKHQIMLKLKIKTYVITDAEVMTVDYSTDICLAESIIVGMTPETVAHFTG